MATIKLITAGAAGGIVAAIASFAVILSAVTAFKEGPVSGLAVLVASPLYILLYIVVFFKTLVTAGVLTGSAAGLCVSLLRRPWSIILSSLSGIISGSFFGVRFTDIVLESRDTPMDLLAGGVAGGLFLAASGAAICTVLRRSFSKTAV